MSASLDEQVIAMIGAKAALSVSTITPATTFAELGIDSLAAIELIFQFEDTFNITIPDDAVRDMRTVGDVITTLGAALSGVSPGP